MSTILILLAGLIVVVGGILFLKLHAFVALVLAALLVASLTDATDIIRSQVMARSVRLQLSNPDELHVLASGVLRPDINWILLPQQMPELGAFEPLTVQFQSLPDQSLPDQSLPEPETDRKSVLHYQVRSSQPADVVALLQRQDVRAVKETAFAAAVKVAQNSAVTRTSEALGSSCGRLAILIVAASIIGQCLLKSGAADRVVDSTLRFCGERAAPAAFAVSGFVLAIPVFFDTVFLLMVPLGKSLFRRTGRNYLLYVLSIVIGATMAHSLVPPTPGPLFIAAEFQVPLPRMIVGGCAVGLFAAAAGLLFAVWMNHRCQLIPPEFRVPKQQAGSVAVAALPSEDTGQHSRPAAETSRWPSLVESLLPVLLPVGLMTLENRFDPQTGLWSLGPLQPIGIWSDVLRAICERNMALILGAVAALVTYVRFQRPTRDQAAAAVQSAISTAGTIILVTAAGGAFGEMMKQTSVAETLQQIPAASPVAIVIAAFGVTAAIRAAQGSATVAMITAAGVFGALVTSGEAGIDPLYVALAVGCGSKPFPWMNDSGFLVITRMSGMTEAQGLKYLTPLLTIAGLAGLLAVIAGVLLFP